MSERQLTDYRAAHSCCEACIEARAAMKTPHHIRTRGAWGDDGAENLISLCAEHHGMIHAMGVKTFAARFPFLEGKIRAALERSRV